MTNRSESCREESAKVIGRPQGKFLKVSSQFHCSVHTGEHHLNKVSFVNVFGGGQPLEDVLVVQVVAEKQDLVVHAEEAALWELQEKRRYDFCTFEACKLKIKGYALKRLMTHLYY